MMRIRFNHFYAFLVQYAELIHISVSLINLSPAGQIIMTFGMVIVGQNMEGNWLFFFSNPCL
jgi:hypothetical protein